MLVHTEDREAVRVLRRFEGEVLRVLGWLRDRIDTVDCDIAAKHCRFPGEPFGGPCFSNQVEPLFVHLPVVIPDDAIERNVCLVELP